ncbi:response regulator transcription factor [Paenibacillus hexagrammi]|uniref:Response regulator transcription factor n=1 Tax=Paenibacillus hexagrammi TaxID=2908839 RepID=A0ABY3SKL3_9BACL|nr:response regulator transcription factor [Paenibacillus sp. YPD9-1]UJF33915.1 response regulator transcription factor [Paenibacillus sp. YPD9-1]
MPSSEQVVESTDVQLSYGSDGSRAADIGSDLGADIEGAYCTESSRIAIVSPFPNKHSELVKELTQQCYDVMLFHRADSLAIIGLPMDAVIIDVKALDVSDDRHKLQEWADRAGKTTPLLWIASREGTSREGLHSEAIHQLGGAVAASHQVQDTVKLIKSLLQQQSPQPPHDIQDEAGSYTFKDLKLDARRMTLTVAHRPVVLTKTEYLLLLFLLESDGAVLQREELLNRVWGSHYFGGSNVVDVHMKSLRKKLGDSASHPEYIVTVRGVGYRLAT